jgi:hypothetical protein
LWAEATGLGETGLICPQKGTIFFNPFFFFFLLLDRSLSSAN